MDTAHLNRRKLHGMMGGLMMLASTMAALSMVRLWDTYAWAECGAAALQIAAWVILFISGRHLWRGASLGSLGPAALAALILSLLEAVFILLAVRAQGMTETVFSDGRVMACWYVTLLLSFYLYHKLLKALHRAAREAAEKNGKKVPSAAGDGWGMFAVILLCLLAIPASALGASRGLHIAVTAAACGGMLAAQIFMCLRMYTYEKTCNGGSAGKHR